MCGWIMIGTKTATTFRRLRDVFLAAGLESKNTRGFSGPCECPLASGKRRNDCSSNEQKLGGRVKKGGSRFPNREIYR